MDTDTDLTVWISIHVLRVEDDLPGIIHSKNINDFNPRPPCGGRLLWILLKQLYPKNFNPRPPCGGRLLPKSLFVFPALFQSTSSVWRTTVDRKKSDKIRQFQSTSSVWRTTAKTEKNLYLHSYNTAICIDLQSHQSAHATVCTNNPKQSPQKPVRSIRVRGDRSMFARPSSPDGALRKSERHPAGRRGELRRVPLCFGNGCPAGKSAGCPLPGRSVWSARP